MSLILVEFIYSSSKIVSDVQRCLETHGITYKGTTLKVENTNNTCDIPQKWEDFAIKVFLKWILFNLKQLMKFTHNNVGCWLSISINVLCLKLDKLI